MKKRANGSHSGILVLGYMNLNRCILTSVYLFVSVHGAPKCGAMTNYAPSGEFTWLDTLGTIAMNKVDPSKSFTNIAEMLDDGASRAVGLSATTLAIGSIPSNLWDGSSSSFTVGVSGSCGDCLLQFVNDVIALRASRYLSNTCEHASAFSTQPCIHSLSSALVQFNICNDLGGSSDLVPDTGAPRCVQPDLVSLDVNFGMYENLVSKALYGSYSSGSSFSDSLANLPCNSCFENFVTNLISYGTTNMKSASACGPIMGSSRLFIPDCFSTAFGSNVGFTTKSISTEISDLEKCLGGGFSIPYHSLSRSESRCSANELQIVSSYSLYNSIVQCSLNEPTPLAVAFDTATMTYTSSFKTCMRNALWGQQAFDLISGIDVNNDALLTCWGCFGSLVAALSADRGATNFFPPHFHQLCTGPGKSSYDPKCIAAITGSGLIDTLAQCVGGDSDEIFPTTTNTCSASVFEALGTLATSSIPPIKAAYIAANSVWPGLSDDLTSQRVRALGVFLSLISSENNFLPTVACYSCFEALVVTLVQVMQDANTRLACQDILSDPCIENSQIKFGLQNFLACSGNALVTSNSPYACSESDSTLIQDNAITQTIFLISIVQRSPTLVQALSTFRALLRSLDSSLTCSPCLENLLTNLYTLDPTTIAKCSSTTTDSASECLVAGHLLDPQIIYTKCSGLQLTFAADSNSTTTTTTSSTTMSPTLPEDSSSMSNSATRIDHLLYNIFVITFSFIFSINF